MADPAIWHVSAITSLLRCGEAFRRRHVAREGAPPTTPQIRGTAVHRGIGSGLLMQQASRTPAPPDLMEDVAASEVDRARHGGATFSRDEMAAGTARTWGAVKDQAVRFAGAYARLVAPSVQPVAVERRVTVADVIPGILLRGTIDLVDGAGGTDTIRDEKTTGRDPHDDAAERSQQLTMYDLLRSAEDPGRDPQAVRPVSLDYLILDAATLEVRHRRLASTRGPGDRAAMVARVRAAARAVEAGAFLPANPETDWWCSIRWCEFAPTCPYFIGRRTPAATR